MPKANVNGIHLYYEIHGKGEPIFFITGFNADRTLWKNIIDYYSKTYQVIVIDNRGSGASDCPDVPYTIEMMADDAACLCKVLDIHSAHFVGASMGGTIVQTIAYKYPELVRKAVLCNSYIKTDIKSTLFNQGYLELLKTNIPHAAKMKMILSRLFSSDFLNQEGIVDLITEISLANPTPMTVIGYKNQLHALLEFNSESWIHQIKVPCLVIGSDQDMIVSEAHMRNMANQIPNAVYHCFKGAGHLVHIEQPDAFNEVVRQFLS